MLHPSKRFPRGPEDLTAEWLTYALRSSGVLPVGEVGAVECELVPYQGAASRVYGLTLTYLRVAAPPPTKLIAKIPPLTTYQSDQELWNGFVAEATFYQNNTRSPLPIPVCYFVDVAPQGHEGFVLLLEDLRPLVPLIFVDTEQQLLAGVEGTMKSLAMLHAHFWHKDAMAEQRGVEVLYTPGTKEFIEYSRPTMEAIRARYKDRVPKPLLAYCEAIQRESGALARGFMLAPRTLTHFDIGPAQVMAGHPNRPAMLIDWATVRYGSPTVDVPINLGPLGAPHELQWARTYHATLSHQLGRDHAWPWEDFHLRYRCAPPNLGISLYAVAFMTEEAMRRALAGVPDRPWFRRPTWQEWYLEWPAQWIERHRSVEAIAELEALGQASLEADPSVFVLPSAPEPENAESPAERPRTMPPPATSLSSVPPARASAPAPLVLVPQHARGPAKRFPSAAEDLTPRWLTEALRSSGAIFDGEVVKVDIELVEHQGQASRVYGLKLEYSGRTEPPPTRLVAKIPPAVSYQPTADQENNYKCEAIFYRHYGRDPLLPIPTCYFADVGTGSNTGFVLLLEDLRPLIPLEFAAQEHELEDGMIATMQAVAALHARFWRRDALARQTWLTPAIFRGHPDSAAWTRNVVERVRAKYNARMPAILQQFCDLVSTESTALAWGFSLFPRTLVHFDVHPRQVMFGTSRKAMLIDWASCIYGLPALDVCISGGPWAAAREEHWLRTYYAALNEHLARDNQSWSWDDLDLCVRAHPPRIDILLYAIAYMEEAQLAAVTETMMDRPWMRRPTWQEYAFEWTAEWMERHRTLEAFAEITARGVDLQAKAKRGW